MKGSTAGRISANVHDIEASDFGLKEYDDTSLRKALRKQEWQEAANILLPVIDPVLPYLDLKENNAVSLALDAGEYLMKAAAVKSKGYLTKEARELGREQYLEACRILKAVSKAEWFSGAEPAQLRSILCLIFLGETDKAEKELEETREPDRWDAAYGLYWMAKAHLHFAGGRFRSAIDDVVQSLIFETKNIDTFPDALLLSARCYEEMLEWHRARDVYYEVVKLFSGTYWQDFAVNRLEYIMAEGLTKSGEVTQVEYVFFGIDEEANELGLLRRPTIELCEWRGDRVMIDRNQICVSSYRLIAADEDIPDDFFPRFGFSVAREGEDVDSGRVIVRVGGVTQHGGECYVLTGGHVEQRAGTCWVYKDGVNEQQGGACEVFKGGINEQHDGICFAHDGGHSTQHAGKCYAHDGGRNEQRGGICEVSDGGSNEQRGGICYVKDGGICYVKDGGR